MKNQSFQWRRSAVAVAVGLCVMTGASYGQSNTTGNIYGQVQSTAGVSIVIENLATGTKRTLTPDAQGRFVASSMPTGTYKAVLMRNGAVVGTVNNVEVTIGQGREVQFAETAATQTVQVVGKVAQIDVSTASNSSNFTAKQLAALPIAKNLNAIIQLAPNTTRADPRYAGGASMGGGAPSENSYYINGFPVTNPLSQLGSMELPFGAIGNADIATGGFGAEFGRSTGGVINIITKGGTNSWEGGVGASVTPESLRGSRKDIYYPNTGYHNGTDPTDNTDGKLYRLRKDNTENESSIGAYIGGPLIKDQLFMFVAVERLYDNANSVVSSDNPNPGALRYSSGGWAERKNTNDRYLAKFDWNLTNDHRLELTMVGDKYKQTEKLYGFDYATLKHDGVLAATDTFENIPNQTNGDGGSAQILKYTGYLTDDLTVNVLGGQLTSPHKNKYVAASGASGLRQIGVIAAAPGLTYSSPYPFPINTTIVPDNSEDTVKSMRFDLEYRMGEHSLRGGLDSVRLKSKNAGEFQLGGGTITYRSTTNGSLLLGPAGPNQKTPIAAGALTDGTNYFYGRERVFSDATDAGSDQAAQYIEDKWQVTKDLSITGGLRNETYKNKNGDGETFLKMDNQINPRLAFSWDAMGDASTQVYGSAGRYAVQIPTHLAVRGASRSTLTNRYFVYTGVDANGQPTGVTDISETYSPDGEFGQAKDAKTVAAQHLKPNSQDELTLGLKKALSDELTVGTSITYRRLVSTIDDFCDQRPFDKYAADKGIDTTNWGGFSCASFNPGKANDFLINYAGDGTTYTKVHLSKEDLGFPTARRTYLALNLWGEHPLKDGWYGKVAYTYAKNKGNTEGQTLSDVAQTDVSATQTWDFKEIMDYAYGYLPGDRRHQVKAFGFYQLTPELDIGANALLASGRPKNCIGNYGGTSTDNPDYGAATHYCTINGVTSPAPRGTAGNLPWDKRLDMNLTYKPEMIKGLSLRVDVFNVLNTQVAQAVNELHEPDDDPTTVSETYGRVLSYTPSRSIKLSASYDVKF